jgi:ribonuclease R
MAKVTDIDLHGIARATIKRYGFDFTAGKPVIDEVNALDPAKLLDGMRAGRKDLRSLLWSSIDNADSLDLDQLEYCERGPNNEIIVRIAISDVDLFVPIRSQTDIYAARNGASVYTGVDVFPLLPSQLSNGLTSLLPDADHAALIVEFSVLPDGSNVPGSIYRALIRNKAKLVYEEVGEWMEGRTEIPASVSVVPGLKEQLALQDEAAGRLSRFRIEQGALEFGAIEPKLIVKEEKVKSLFVEKRNRAHFIIENFMIAANGAMSHFLKNAGLPMIQRVVRVPKNWQGIIDIAGTFRERLPLKPDARALAHFLQKRRTADPERFPDVSLAVIKLLGPGEYVMLEPHASSSGHFSLAVTDYTHGTAPNRRYVDELIQRLIKAAMDGKACPYDRKELIYFAAFCTDRDKAAKKVERFMRKAAAAVLLSGRVGETFDAIVTGASVHGVYVRVETPPVEGRVMRKQKGMGVGQKVRVRLIGMDPYMGQIDFEKC